MKIGIILTARWWRFSLNLEELGEAFQQLGHEVVLFCRGNDGGECRIPLVVMDPEQEESAEFWQGLDFAICFTYFSAAPLHRALGRAGVFQVIRADTDGQLGFRVFPKAAFLRLVHPARGVWDAIRRFRHFLNCCWFYESTVARTVMESVEAVDGVVVEMQPARENLTKFLKAHHREDLVRKISVISHPVSSRFLESDPAGDPGPSIYCAGRWDDDQKNAPLALAALKLALNEDPQLRVTIAGSFSAEAFSDLAANPRVKILGKVPHERIVPNMDGARLLFSSSRWEGFPISGLEMLCRGRTIVAPPVPGFVELTGGGAFGSIAAGHSARALVDALRKELALWGRGERVPDRIASVWRGRVTHAAVAGLFLKLYEARHIKN